MNRQFKAKFIRLNWVGNHIDILENLDAVDTTRSYYADVVIDIEDNILRIKAKKAVFCEFFRKKDMVNLGMEYEAFTDENAPLEGPRGLIAEVPYEKMYSTNVESVITGMFWTRKTRVQYVGWQIAVLPLVEETNLMFTNWSLSTNEMVVAKND